MSDDAKIAMVRQRWDDFAARYTETLNKRLTLQCAKEMHANMALSAAQSVLEVAAGAGLGSLDIAQRMAVGATAKKQFMVTDLSPTMVEMAKETLKNASSEHLDVQVKEANGQDLQDVATSSIDRFISTMCLQLTPDPDAMLREAKRVLKADGFAGFTIWGRPEFSGVFTIDAAMNKELGLSDGAEHPNFAMGKDLNALRHKFAAAGFSQVRIWPFLCVLELWSGEGYSKFQEEVSFDVGDEALRARRFEVARRMGDEWLATKGFPIGQETYIIVAKAQQIKKGVRRCSPALTYMFMLQQVEVAGVRKKPRQNAGHKSPSTKTVFAMGGAKIAMVRQAWSDIAVHFTATANKRMTLQCAEEMHKHLDLGKAFDVLEIGAGAGLGSLDIIKRMMDMLAVAKLNTKATKANMSKH